LIRDTKHNQMEISREPIYFSVETLNRFIDRRADFTRPCPYTYEQAQAMWLGTSPLPGEGGDGSEQTVCMIPEECPVDKKRKKDHTEIPS
jgi:hypothetical protein